MQMQSNEKPIVAAFDFDGTITYFDSLVPFLLFSKGPLEGIPKLLIEIPTVFSWITGKTTRQSAKESVISRFLKGMPFDLVNTLAQQYASGILNKIVRPAALRRIAWHKEKGHRCILISASLNIYLEPWGRQHGFEDFITSKPEVDSNGNITGKLLGKNCWGEEKIQRLTELLGPRDNYTLYAYGDTKGDKPLMEFADFSYYKEMPEIDEST